MTDMNEETELPGYRNVGGTKICVLPKSQRVTDEIEDAAELLAEGGLADDVNGEHNDELLTITEAAAICERSSQWIELQIHSHLMPSEKHGRRRYVRKSVCETTRELLATHGRDWRKHATWQVPDEAPETEDAEAPESDEDAVDGTALMQSIRTRAEECRQEGRFEASAELFALLVDFVGA